MKSQTTNTVNRIEMEIAVDCSMANARKNTRRFVGIANDAPINGVTHETAVNELKRYLRAIALYSAYLRGETSSLAIKYIGESEYLHVIHTDKLHYIGTNVVYMITGTKAVTLTGNVYRACCICGDWEYESACYEYNGKYYCSTSCLWEHNLYACDSCHAVVGEDDAIITPDGYTYCSEQCANNDDYFRCDECGEWTHRYDLVYTDDSAICNDCYELGYFTCDECERVLPNDQYGEYGTCRSCLDQDSPYIHEYGYNAPIVYYGDNREKASPYMGVELEVDDGWDRDALAYDMVHGIDTKLFWMTYDCSLNHGVEITSEPCTLSYYLDANYFEAVREHCRNYGFSSHDAGTCGMHVHINRDFFDDLPTDGLTRNGRYISNYEKCAVGGLRIARLLGRFERELTVFTRRNNNDEWCSYRYTHDYAPKDGNYSDDTEIDKANSISGTYGHSICLNWEHRNSLEYRIFRGTLNVSTIYASLALVHTLTRYVKYHTLATCETVTWTELMRNLINDPTLPAEARKDFTDYLVKRGLLRETYATWATLSMTA